MGNTHNITFKYIYIYIYIYIFKNVVLCMLQVVIHFKSMVSLVLRVLLCVVLQVVLCMLHIVTQG